MVHVESEPIKMVQESFSQKVYVATIYGLCLLQYNYMIVHQYADMVRPSLTPNQFTLSNPISCSLVIQLWMLLRRMATMTLCWSWRNMELSS